MAKRLQVLLDEQEYAAIQGAARSQRLTVAEWVRRTLRKAREERPGAAEAKLRAIADASRHAYPIADIGAMLNEIEAGRRLP